ncbi:growth/differentiation factor 8-like [Paramacrobiotus metropolitanus]|uniref:growth/differentiation factor 8-like n=1 Tax=Paramacrobiotus metropolitanus TaxID=2943436 RepID=UPI0024462D68|nr:growth/differentiation factor 8-like [Paramacrobiotus metropolitanus]XP_055342482.1 growth/differentiation factor 8-like [Paramacrobiotus metropolitanus]
MCSYRMDYNNILRRAAAAWMYPWLYYTLLTLCLLSSTSLCRHTSSAPHPQHATPMHRHHNRTCKGGGVSVAAADRQSSSAPAALASGSCLTAGPTLLNRAVREDSFKKDMLNKLGFRDGRIPQLTEAQKRNPSHIHSIRKHIEEIMQRQQEEEPDEAIFQPSRVVLFPEPLPSEWNVPAEMRNHSFFFNVTTHVRKSEQDKSSLHVYIRGTGGDEAKGHLLLQPLKMRAELLVRSGGAGGSLRVDPVWTQEASRVVELKKHGQWAEFRLSKFISHWRQDHDVAGNYGLLVSALDAEGTNWALLHPATEDEKSFGMYLDVMVRPKPKRIRRGLQPDCSEDKPGNYCCRYPLQINFTAMGWGFVVHPRTYEAYYCSGPCGTAADRSTFNPALHYAHLASNALAETEKTRPRRQQDQDANVGPCCTPSRALDMEIIYYGENGELVTGMLPGMSVARCACA